MSCFLLFSFNSKSSFVRFSTNLFFCLTLKNTSTTSTSTLIVSPTKLWLGMSAGACAEVHRGKTDTTREMAERDRSERTDDHPTKLGGIICKNQQLGATEPRI